MTQIAKIQNSFLRVFLNLARIVYILVKFTVHIVHIDWHGAKIVIDELHNGLDVITVFDHPLI
ncbi:MAG TPA: hypothetical protein VKA34_17570 [Balneolales bacterium]|nr:hypothetical protein [Balneolales bacterium]